MAQEKNTLELYIVSGRIDTDVLYPRVFRDKESAEEEVKEIIYLAARESYLDSGDGEEENPSWETLEDWAMDSYYEFEFAEDRGVFYDGSEYTEAEITKHVVTI